MHGAWNTAAPEAFTFKDTAAPEASTFKDSPMATSNVSQLSMLKAACNMVERVIGDCVANLNIKTHAVTFTPVSAKHASDAGNAGNASDVGNANHAGDEGAETAGGNACDADDDGDEGDADNIGHIGDAWFKQNFE